GRGDLWQRRAHRGHDTVLGVEQSLDDAGAVERVQRVDTVLRHDLPCLRNLGQPARMIRVSAAVQRQAPSQLLERKNLEYRQELLRDARARQRQTLLRADR